MRSLARSPTEGWGDGVMVSNSWLLSLDLTRKEGSGAAKEPFLSWPLVKTQSDNTVNGH